MTLRFPTFLFHCSLYKLLPASVHVHGNNNDTNDNEREKKVNYLKVKNVNSQNLLRCAGVCIRCKCPAVLGTEMPQWNLPSSAVAFVRFFHILVVLGNRLYCNLRLGTLVCGWMYVCGLIDDTV